MSNLEKSQNGLLMITPNSELELIQGSIVKAFERTGTDPYDMENMVIDVLTEFDRIEMKIIVRAIKRGSLGEFGRTYKLTTQEVCYWIHQHLNQHAQLANV